MSEVPAHRPPGSRNHRGFIGCEGRYDLYGALQFNLLTLGGLREHHVLCDIGCGSLRLGRLLLPYLAPGHYHGVEPEGWLLREGIDKEVGEELVTRRRPSFSDSTEFELSTFGTRFDYLIAHSVFSHASQDQVRTCLRAAREVMTPEGVFYATFHLGRRDQVGGWVYPSLVPYTVGWIQRATTECDLRVRLIDWPHPNDQRWVVLTRADVPAKVGVKADPTRNLAQAALRMRVLRTRRVSQLLALRRHIVRSRGAGDQRAVVDLREPVHDDADVDADGGRDRHIT